MRRRAFIAALGGAVALPLSAGAQPSDRVRRIAMLMNFSDADPATRQLVDQFRRGLADAGWVEGRNLRIDYRWHVTDAARAQAYASELLQAGPEVILASGGVSMEALKSLNRTTPVVFVLITDPVAQGYVSNLARPGGNTTGFASQELSIGGKWLELLRELVPSLSHVAVVYAPDVNSYAPLLVRPMQALEGPARATTAPAPVRSAEDIEKVIQGLDGSSGAFVVLQDAYTVAQRKLIIELAARQKVCGMYATPIFVRDGGLAMYGPDVRDQFARAASYVDRILRGAQAGDLPVQQPVKFQFILNLKTAKILGLSIAPTLLARADEVIE
jgi:putative ABC transport system substrate-binding protein